MNKELLYSGLSSVPSDYSCKDGELESSLNLINEDGALHPVSQPKPIMDLQENERVVIIHSTSVQKNYILLRGDSLYWVSTDAENTNDALFIMDAPGFKDMAAIGNTLSVAFRGGLFYILWRDTSYLCLGRRPPFVSIDFGLSGSVWQGTFEMKLAESITRLDSSALQKITQEHMQDVNNAVWGSINKTQADICKRGLYSQPFFVRYAFRMYDGTHIWHSAPILLIPTTSVPAVTAGTMIKSGQGLSYNADRAIASLNPKCLLYRISETDKELLELWGDVIVGIDIFSSEQVFLYDATKDIIKSIHMLGDSLTTWSSWASDLFERNNNGQRPGAGDSSGSSSSGSGTSGGRRPGSAGVENSPDDVYSWEDIGITLSPGEPEVIQSDNENTPDEDTDDKYDLIVYRGHFAEYGYNFCEQYENITRGNSAIGTPYPCYWNIPANESWLEDIKSVHNFYKIASINISDVQPMKDFQELRIKSTSNDVLVNSERLDDDYQSHCNLYPYSLYAFNSRLNIGGLDIQAAEPFPIRSLAAYNNPEGDDLPMEKCSIKVWTRINGIKTCVTHVAKDCDADTFKNFKKDFPRYLFYPDSKAYRMQFSFDDEKITINLTPHDFLNGAFYFGGFGINPTPESATYDEDEDNDDGIIPKKVPLPSKVYTSEVDNPFVFKPTGIATVGSGTVIALSSTAVALSQGQFGQFPLIAFTTEGIWALESSSTGSFVARHPLSRDVCINRDGIAQTDTSIIFPSRRGIMMVSGAEVTSITDNIASPFPFDLDNLKGMDHIHRFMGHDVKSCSCISIQPFSKFCETCRICYDYQHQRIILIDPKLNGNSYAYVFSLKSGFWGAMRTNLKFPVNAYPDSLAVNNMKQLVNLSHEGEFQPGLIITRPLKLDNPDILKTINAVIQRGYFRTGHIQSILYGSRNLFDWHLVWSSKDHTLRGFSGTPYKYFRIALLCHLSPEESITGASIQYITKFTNNIK